MTPVTRRWSPALAVLGLSLAASPARGQETPPLTRADAEAILELEGAERHRAACGVLATGLLQQVFGVDPAAVETHPMTMARIPHGVCTAHWEKPGREALEAECAEQVMAHAQRRAQAMMRREDFDEPMPRCPPTSVRVTVTVVNPVFESPAEAVASLESVVGILTEGIEVEVMGETRTTRVEFDRWVEGVGDRAAWAPRVAELHVASRGLRFAVAVTGLDDDEAAFDRAVALATRLAG